MTQGAKQAKAGGRVNTMIMAWQAAGRSMEIASSILQTEGTDQTFHYDPFFGEVFQDVPQTKTRKNKLVAFCAGRTRHTCYFNTFFVRLVLNVFDPPDDQGLVMSCPELQGTSSPGRKLGTFFKELVPGKPGKCKWGTGGGVPGLNSRVTASGIRVGVINMGITSVPPVLVAAVTGHDLTVLNALFEYVRARRANVQPMAVVTAGFNPLPYGQNGFGPRHPTLDALTLDVHGRGKLQSMLIDVMHLGPEAPRRLRRGGDLFVVCEAAMATFLMYYDEHRTNGEWSVVCGRLRTAYCLHFLGGRMDAGLAHRGLKQLGDPIRVKFKVENVKIMTSEGTTGVLQLTEVVKELHKELLLGREERVNLSDQLIDLQVQLSSLGRSASSSFSSAADGAAVPLLLAAESSPSPSTEKPAVMSIFQRAAAKPRALVPRDFSRDFLVSQGGKQKPAAITCTGVDAPVLFTTICQRHAGQVPAVAHFVNKQHRIRCSKVVTFFKAMATKEEMTVLMDKDAAKQLARTAITNNLNDLLVMRFKEAFAGTLTGLVPASLKLSKSSKRKKSGKYGRHPTMGAGAIESRLGELSKLKVDPSSAAAAASAAAVAQECGGPPAPAPQASDSCYDSCACVHACKVYIT